MFPHALPLEKNLRERHVSWTYDKESRSKNSFALMMMQTSSCSTSKIHLFFPLCVLAPIIASLLLLRLRLLRPSRVSKCRLCLLLFTGNDELCVVSYLLDHPCLLLLLLLLLLHGGGVIGELAVFPPPSPGKMPPLYLRALKRSLGGEQVGKDTKLFKN